MARDDQGYLFIDENVRIATDEAAREALSRRSDAPFVTDEGGIASVPEHRWVLAQTAERKHWMDLGIRSDDDHNYRNAARFGFYEPLRGLSFAHAVELGCGPFTNLRIVADVCCLGSCDLLDPLVESYLGHPYCRYTRTYLRIERTGLNGRLRRFIIRHPKLGLRRFADRRRLPIDRLLAVPIERMPLDRSYDLVVMQNVLEHCYDARRVFANIGSVTRPGATIVIHDRYYDAGQVREFARRVWDAAHPLRVDRRLAAEFLAGFEGLYSKVIPVKTRFMGIDTSADHFYFIGRRRG